eukprot:CAMPEP_0202956216 /NCGR_PEP_ID=MMETSP1396-20130829/743_1 /ASSEMBLY_ACC=CAM_ASM_000872 /TAXON_ID= /ORGANISM="Pseudokeronopsis sp., Strain Brazil" /LENGTH=295 /DNA_ID=CAMNT_0049673135 /DNA_START=586 /DNA_END=1473 /DNA_ORIENTATION=-
MRIKEFKRKVLKLTILNVLLIVISCFVLRSFLINTADGVIDEEYDKRDANQGYRPFWADYQPLDETVTVEWNGHEFGGKKSRGDYDPFKAFAQAVNSNGNRVDLPDMEDLPMPSGESVEGFNPEEPIPRPPVDNFDQSGETRTEPATMSIAVSIAPSTNIARPEHIRSPPPPPRVGHSDFWDGDKDNDWDNWDDWSDFEWDDVDWDSMTRDQAKDFAHYIITYICLIALTWGVCFVGVCCGGCLCALGKAKRSQKTSEAIEGHQAMLIRAGNHSFQSVSAISQQPQIIQPGSVLN